MESELTDVQKQMQDQESEAVNAIAKWEQNVIELEEKCVMYEENLKMSSKNNAVDTINGKPNFKDLQPRTEDASHRNTIDCLETSQTGNSNYQVESEAHSSDTIEELRQAFKTAQDTLAKDEEVVQQWEGK